MLNFQSKNLRIFTGLFGFLLLITLYLLLRNGAMLITGEQLDRLIERGHIVKIVQEDPYLYISTKDKNLYKIPISVASSKNLGESYPIEIHNSWSIFNSGLGILILILLALASLFYFLIYRNRKGAIETLDGAWRADTTDKIKPTQSKVRFKDIAGNEDLKEDLKEIIDFLKHPKLYKKFEIRLPKGVLLSGPPGVGKTLIAKAVAGEAGVPFFYQSGASIVEIYVGMGAKRIHELFQVAKKSAPAIIFIDEIDAVGRQRGNLNNEEREATLNQLLTEMDGFENNSGVIVIGATNRIEILDQALLRPGRFDRRIHLSLQNRDDRKKILELYLRRKPYDVDLDELARSTVGFSAAALSTLVNEAALRALKRGAERIEEIDFDEIKETVISGKRKILSFNKQERKIQAVYQSAKALVATWLDVPYNQIGIVTTQMQEAEREIVSKSDIISRIKVLLAGSVATKIAFNEIYSNGTQDRAEAIKELRHLISEYGMGEHLIPREEEIEKLLISIQSEVELMLNKLEEARHTIEVWMLEHENIQEDEARRMLRELF